MPSEDVPRAAPPHVDPHPVDVPLADRPLAAAGATDRPSERPVGPPLVVAHRGSSATYAEQTVGAYRAALADGADMLECDVRLTSDWQLVAVHDRLVDRTSDGHGSVASMSLGDLKALDFGSWRYSAPGAPPQVAALGADPANREVAALRDILDLAVSAGREVGLAVETKHPTRYVGAVEHAVADLLDEYDVASAPGTGRVWACVMSFSSLAVRRFAAIRPDMGLVQLIGAGRVARHLLDTVPRVATTAGLDVDLVRSDPAIVADQHGAGRRVYVWTVDDPADVAMCLDLGVDAIITNRPGPVRTAVDARAAVEARVAVEARTTVDARAAGDGSVAASGEAAPSA